MAYLYKLKLLVLPTLFWTFIAIGGVLILRYFVEFILEVNSINRTIWDWWIPGIVANVFWILLLRKRFKLFYNRQWKNNQEVFIYMGIVAPIVFAISFGLQSLEYAMLEVKSVHSTEEIDVKDWKTVYAIDSVQIDTNAIYIEQIAEVSGRYNQHLNYYCYLLSPILSYSKNETFIWLGVRYSKQVSNTKSEEFKNSQWQSFYRVSLENFKGITINKKHKLFPVHPSSDLRYYQKALKKNILLSKFEHRIFELSSDEIQQESNAFINFLLISLGVLMLVCMIVALLPVCDITGLDRLLKGKSVLSQDEKVIRRELVFAGDYPITVLFCYTISILYILTATSDGNLFYIQGDVLFSYGGMKGSAFDSGEYWRMLSSMFLHNSFVHFLTNGILFFVFALVIEPGLSKLKFITLILVGGLGGEVASYWFIEPHVVSIGASGIVFALFGWGLVSYFINGRNNTDLGMVLILSPIMLIGLGLGFILSGINNAAHLGGLATGLFLAFIIHPKRKY